MESRPNGARGNKGATRGWSGCQLATANRAAGRTRRFGFHARAVPQLANGERRARTPGWCTSTARPLDLEVFKIFKQEIHVFHTAVDLYVHNLDRILVLRRVIPLYSADRGAP